MKKIYSSFIFALITLTGFSQEGIKLQKIDNQSKNSFIANGTKVAVILTDGTHIKGTLADEDAYTLLVNRGDRSTIINYSSVNRIVTYKETEYFSLTGEMFDGMGSLGNADCGNSCNGPHAACIAVVLAGVCVGIVATELIVECTSDLVNDNYYSMTNWKIAS